MCGRVARVFKLRRQVNCRHHSIVCAWWSSCQSLHVLDLAPNWLPVLLLLPFWIFLRRTVSLARASLNSLSCEFPCELFTHSRFPLVPLHPEGDAQPSPRKRPPPRPPPRAPPDNCHRTVDSSVGQMRTSRNIRTSCSVGNSPSGLGREVVCSQGPSLG